MFTWSLLLFFVGEENRDPSRNKKVRKRTSVILPAEVPLPTPGLEYTPLGDEQSDQLIASLTQSFYRHVSRFVYFLSQKTTFWVDHSIEVD